MKFNELNLILAAYEYYQYENNTNNTLQKLVDVEKLEKEHSKKKCCKCWSWWTLLDNKLSMILNMPQYELLQNFLSLFNLLFIAINDFMTTKSSNYVKTWMLVMIGMNNFFLLELIVDLVFFGVINAFKNHLRVWFEIVCQALNIFAMIKFFQDMNDVSTYNFYEKIFCLIIFIRALKIDRKSVV